MPIADKLTRLQLRSLVRNELLDSNSRWWTDTEINHYLDDWQKAIQDQHELVWAEGTATTSSPTLDLITTFPTMLRPDRLYWNNVRIPVRSVEDMNGLDPYWREAQPGSPYIAIQHTRRQIELWPNPSTAGELLAEFPSVPTFSSDATVQEVPAWVKFSAVPYCSYRAYLRHGPNSNLNLALRYKSQFTRLIGKYTTTKTAFFPERSPSLKVGGRYEAGILNPLPFGTATMPIIINLHHQDEVPSGAINGTNVVFTLTYNPDPDISLKLWVDGVLMTQGTHYNLSTTTITFVSPYQPLTGQTLFATYRYNV